MFGIFCREYRFQLIVSQSSEIKILIRVEVEMLGEKTVIDGFKCFRAFGDDDDIGPGFFLDRFSEPSYGEKFVFVYHAFVTGEKNREGRSYESMLIGIVEQDDVDVRSLFRQFAYASAPVGIDGNRYGGKFVFYL